MSVLEASARFTPLERAYDRDRAMASIPAWVTDAGYVAMDYAVPEYGQTFYDGARDKVLCCQELETLPFVLVQYRGGARR